MPPGNTSAAQPPDTKLIFVVGNSRSGTTMMARIFGLHPSVLMFRELHYFEELSTVANSQDTLNHEAARSLLQTLLSIQRIGYMAPRQQELFSEEAEELLASLGGPITRDRLFQRFLRYETTREGRSAGCEQTPRNIFYLDRIFELFPDATVIEMVRDPRDVLLSKKRKWRRGFLGGDGMPVRAAALSWANYHPLVTSRLWSSAIQAGNRWSQDDRVLRIQFEKFLQDPDSHIQKICSACGIAFNPSMLDVPHIGSSLSTDGQSHGINRGATGRWRQGLNHTEIHLCEQATRNEMLQLGYEPAGERPNLLLLLASYLQIPVKLSAALILNLGRLGSVREAVVRRRTARHQSS